MARWLPAALIVVLGLVAIGWYAHRAHGRRIAALESAAADAQDMERQADAARARAALFDCGNRYRDATDWGAYCRSELRDLADAEKRATQ